MTSTGLTDLDELVLSCRTENARTYIQEALIAYRGGAHRAAIVASWIAVVFDLIDKLRELALSGDKQAKQVIGDFDKHLIQLDAGDLQAIGKALEFEREILDVARDKFQLLDQQQFIDLSRLRDDRNRCAHPTFQREGATYRPSAELARAHIRNAIEHVLRQAPVQGKAAIESVIVAVGSEFFPAKRDEIRVLLAEGPLGRPTEALVTGVVDRLIWDLFTQGSLLYRQSGPISALKAVIELHRAQAEPRVISQAKKLGAKVPDHDLPLLCILAARVSEVWAGLSDGQKHRVGLYIANGPISYVAVIVSHSLRVDYLREVALNRLEKMTVDDLVQTIGFGVGKDAVHRAVELFSTAKNWPAANTIADRVILPLLEHITTDDVAKILRSPRERRSDLPYSAGLTRFIDAVKQRNIIPTKELNNILRDEGLDYLVDDEDAEEAPSGENIPIADDW